MKKSSFIKTITQLVCLCVPLSGFAAVTFQNDGTTAGWDNHTPQHNGTISQVTSPNYKTTTANTSIKFTQTFDPNYTGRYHSEVEKDTTQSNGQDRWYGQAVYIPTSWVDTSGGNTIQQWGTEAPEGPWIQNFIQGTLLKITVPGINNYQHMGSVTKGVWMRIVVHLKMANPGVEEAWFNGTRMFSYSNVNLYNPNGSATIRWSCGLYVTYWFGLSSLPAGDQSVRTVYHDHFRIDALSYNGAEPANW